MNNTTTIANRINTFPFYYENSDDNRKWSFGNNEEKAIKSELSHLSSEELRVVKNSISADEEYVNRYFSGYFTNLPDPIEEVKEKSFRSKIFSEAWSMFRENIFSTFSEALKASWKRAKLLKKLRSGITYFSYTKSDGKIRTAIGTLREGNFFYTYKGQGTTNIQVIKYYDLEARGFRSCRVDRLIQIETI